MNKFVLLYAILQVFERILFIWGMRHPASGYVQGINDLVTPFFLVFLGEYMCMLALCVDTSAICCTFSCQ